MNYDTTIKLDIMACLGDIVLSCGRVILPFLNKLMEMILVYAMGANEVAATKFDLSETIKNCVIDTLFCVFHGLC